MEGGFITKLVVGSVLLGLIVLVFVGFMSSMGNQYGVSVDSQIVTKSNQIALNSQQTQQIFNNATITQQGSSVDSQSQDTGQYRGYLSGEQQKTSTVNIISNSIDAIYEILPFDPAIKGVIYFLIGISFALGIIYMIFKVMP